MDKPRHIPTQRNRALLGPAIRKTDKITPERIKDVDKSVNTSVEPEAAT